MSDEWRSETVSKSLKVPFEEESRNDKLSTCWVGSANFNGKK